jgi:mono/diheme cytochrome c family protein
VVVFVFVGEARAESAAGLAVTIQQLAADGNAIGTPDTREARMVALYVPAGAAPSAFVPAGRFRATWEGALNLKIRERYTFAAEGRGKLTVLVDDKPVFEAAGDDLSKTVVEPVRLKKGENKLAVVYESPATGDAVVRLMWAQKGSAARPLPPMVFTHDRAGEPVARGRTLRLGRQLVAELRCTKCHALPAGTGDAFPELAMDAPSFKDIGARLNAGWMAAWVADPHAVRPDARMPKVFHAGNRPAGMTPENDIRAADAAAYLATLGAAPSGSPGAFEMKDVNAGRKLYAALACVACHVPPDAEKFAPQPARVSHAQVAAKFTPGGLKQYLLHPDAHYTWNPMPDFRLSDVESSQLAAYLLSAGTKKLPAPSNAAKGDAKRGEQLVNAACVACHGGTDQKPTAPAPALADMRPGAAWTRGCMSPDAASNRASPHFELTDEQRAAIASFAATDRSALSRDEPGEFAERQFAVMRCGDCHTRDSVESALTTTLAPEHDATYARLFGVGAPPAETGTYFAPDQKAFPTLTWAGEKLRPEWSAAFVRGQISYKPRPYLRARMPAFKVRATGLAPGFAAQHGIPSQSSPNPAPDPTLVPVGQKLVGTVGGFSCVQCHAVAGKPPLAPFEAPAVDFAHVDDRLQKDFYHRWMEDPLAWDPTTKMPRFSDDDGKTPLRDTLDGDAAKQYEAIWQYLLQGEDVKSPP